MKNNDQALFIRQVASLALWMLSAWLFIPCFVLFDGFLLCLEDPV